MVSGMIYVPGERGNNVKCCDTSCKSAIKMPSLLHELPTRLLSSY